jgi:hypothetical protein
LNDTHHDSNAGGSTGSIVSDVNDQDWPLDSNSCSSGLAKSDPIECAHDRRETDASHPSTIDPTVTVAPNPTLAQTLAAHELMHNRRSGAERPGANEDNDYDYDYESNSDVDPYDLSSNDENYAYNEYPDEADYDYNAYDFYRDYEDDEDRRMARMMRTALKRNSLDDNSNSDFDSLDGE